jgi:hypothetical protein
MYVAVMMFIRFILIPVTQIVLMFTVKLGRMEMHGRYEYWDDCQHFLNKTSLKIPKGVV